MLVANKIALGHIESGIAGDGQGGGRIESSGKQDDGTARGGDGWGVHGIPAGRQESVFEPRLVDDQCRKFAVEEGRIAEIEFDEAA